MPAIRAHEEAFKQLIAALYESRRFAPPQWPADRPLGEPLIVDITVDDIVHSVTYAPAHAQGRDDFFIYSRFGAVPEDLRDAVLTRALELNLAVAPGGTSLGIDPENGDVILTQRMPLSGETGESLLLRLTLISEQAFDWAHTYFLDEDDDLVPATEALTHSFA